MNLQHELRNPVDEAVGPFSIVIVDDHELVRDSLVSSIQLQYPSAQVRGFGSVEEACNALAEEAASLVLLDLNLEATSGIDSLLQLRRWCDANAPETRLLVLSAIDQVDDGIVGKIINETKTGYVSKAAPRHELWHAISATLFGRVYVTERYVARLGAAAKRSPLSELSEHQRRIALLVAHGHTVKEVVRQLEQQGLVVAEATIRAHIRDIAWKVRPHLATSAELPARAVIVTAAAVEHAQAKGAHASS